MKKTLLVVSTVLSMLFAGFAFSADSPCLADRHVAKGVKCEVCHVAPTPGAVVKVNKEKCLACHQSYEVLAQKTAKLEPNPHFNHMGAVRCTDCHTGHTKGQLMCNDCHKFDLQPK